MVYGKGGGRAIGRGCMAVVGGGCGRRRLWTVAAVDGGGGVRLWWTAAAVDGGGGRAASGPRWEAKLWYADPSIIRDLDAFELCCGMGGITTEINTLGGRALGMDRTLRGLG